MSNTIQGTLFPNLLYCKTGFIRPCFGFAHYIQSTVREFKTRANKPSHIECIVFIVTGRIQNRSKQLVVLCKRAKLRKGVNFAFYSTLSRKYLNFRAMSNPGAKEQFLKQFENIVEGIKTNKSKVNIENVIVSATN